MNECVLNIHNILIRVKWNVCDLRDWMIERERAKSMWENEKS